MSMQKDIDRSLSVVKEACEFIGIARAEIVIAVELSLKVSVYNLSLHKRCGHDSR